MNIYVANNKRNKIYDVLARRDVKYLPAISITSRNTSVSADSLHKTRYALLVISIRILLLILHLLGNSHEFCILPYIIF